MGDTEILRDDSYAVAARLRAAGAEVDVQLWRDVPHVWQMFTPIIPEGTKALKKAGAFMLRHLDA